MDMLVRFLARKNKQLERAFRAILLLAVGFGLELTPEQMSLTFVALEAILGVFIDDLNVPKHNVDVRIEKEVDRRVKDILSDPPIGGGGGQP